MGASEIVNGLRKRDPVTFEKISCNTINGWIDCSDRKPWWKESVLRHVQNRDGPGHDKGGSQGILVCSKVHLTTQQTANTIVVTTS